MFALVLENSGCNWQPVAQELIFRLLNRAGGGVDGQVLVVTDMLGMTKGFSPRFPSSLCRPEYRDDRCAIGHYVADVKACDFL